MREKLSLVTQLLPVHNTNLNAGQLRKKVPKKLATTDMRMVRWAQDKEGPRKEWRHLEISQH